MWCQLFQDPEHASFLLNVNKYPEKKVLVFVFWRALKYHFEAGSIRFAQGFKWLLNVREKFANKSKNCFNIFPLLPSTGIHQ